MSSYGIAPHSMAGNQPLSYERSGLPELDHPLYAPTMPYAYLADPAPGQLRGRDARYGSFSHDFPIPSGPAYERRAPHGPPPFTVDPSKIVGDIHADRHAIFATRAPSHPFAPERPFYPFGPADGADTMVVDEPQDEYRASPAPHAVDEPSDWSSDDSDSSDDGPREYSDRRDRESAAYITKLARESRGLPRRRAPEPSPASVPRYPTRHATAGASRGTAAHSSASVSPSKRAAKPSTGNRAAKRQAVDQTFSSRAWDSTLPPPPNSSGISPEFWHLLRLGCKVVGRNALQCLGCPKVTTFADMLPHIVEHKRQQCPVSCEGCPRTFPRKELLTRHMNERRREGPDHASDSRKRYLKLFEARPDVVEMRAKYDYTSSSEVQLMNDRLEEKFNKRFKL
ncbi:hypothetical protein B0H12DRAFT_1232898 [Mycena haematopus]|nr:hypothetical protein B0H12DRAFT_1232898 [Mycena haematopus]